MKPMRRAGAAAVLAIAVSAGTMASRSGRLSVAPIPRRNVRLGSDCLVTNMPVFSLIRFRPRAPHLERHAVDDPANQRLHAVTARRRVLHDRTNVRLIGWFNPAPERIRQHLRDHGAHEFLVVWRRQK